MKKIALIICVLVLNLSCGSQQNSTSTTIPNPPAVPETPSPSPTFDTNGNLVGISAKSNFLVAPFNDWFNFNYENYELNTETIAKLKPLLKNVTIKAFMGTWCGDSQEQTPVFYKILDVTDFKYQNLEMIAASKIISIAPNNSAFNIGV